MIEPDLLYTVLCDEVRREDNGKWLLIGLFEQISAAQFPSHHPALCVINKWCNGQGAYRQQTRFVDSGDRVIFEGEPLDFELKDLDSSFTAVQMFGGLPLEAPGRYFVEILLGGELKQRYLLRVQHVPPA